MTVLDKNDPYVQGKTINSQFKLHVMPTTGKPMIHLTQQQKAEVVLFGDDLAFRTPLLVKAGQKIYVTANEGDDEIKLSIHTVDRDVVKKVPNRLTDVIMAVGELNGSYPDVAQMLIQADRQNNLTGTIGIDALPAPGRMYYRPNTAGKLPGDKSPQKKTENWSIVSRSQPLPYR